MTSQLDSSGRIRIKTLTLFLSIISSDRVTFPPETLPKLLEAFINVAIHTLSPVEEAVKQILNEINPLDVGLLLNYVNVGLSSKNIEAVIACAKAHPIF